jgi:hypothetical protein
VWLICHVQGKVGGAFFASKQNVLQDLQRSSRKAALEFDRKRAGNEVATTMKSAILQLLAVELSALGLGTFVVTAAGTAASVDVTGISRKPFSCSNRLMFFFSWCWITCIGRIVCDSISAKSNQGQASRQYQSSKKASPPSSRGTFQS